MPAGLPPFPSPTPSSSLFENRVARPGAYLKGAEALSYQNHLASPVVAVAEPHRGDPGLIPRGCILFPPPFIHFLHCAYDRVAPPVILS